MHKHAHKIRKYDRNLRLTIATAIIAISIFSFEIIPLPKSFYRSPVGQSFGYPLLPHFSSLSRTINHENYFNTSTANHSAGI